MNKYLLIIACFFIQSFLGSNNNKIKKYLKEFYDEETPAQESPMKENKFFIPYITTQTQSTLKNIIREGKIRKVEDRIKLKED
jgi:hypothetical protein